MSAEEARGLAPPPAGERAQIGVGMLGYAFMGRAHSNAYRRLGEMAPGPGLSPRLVSIAGRDAEAVARTAARYGWETFTTDWREMVADPEIGLFDNGGPNHLHAEPTIAAARSGKHVFCEKPLGRTAAESLDVWRQVEAAGVTHMCGFNYRFVPAVRLAREILAAGEVGEIRHFRISYLQDWGVEPGLGGWRFDPDAAGSGALGDLGTHAVDLARFLVGEVGSVTATTRSFIPGREVDDAALATVEFVAGATGTIEVSRVALGHRNALRWEIEGTRGALGFDLERLNELRVYRHEDGPVRGFTKVLATDPDHPFADRWWPPGHVLGWEHSFVHEIGHLLDAIAGEVEVAPYGATFEDGYRAAEVCDAIRRSAQGGRREQISYETLG